jgi:hypothetical protein
VKPSLRFNSLRWNGAPDSSVSTRLRKQSPNLEEGVVFDDKCIALSNNVLCRSFADRNKMQRLHSRPSGSEQLIAVACDARCRRGWNVLKSISSRAAREAVSISGAHDRANG